MTRTHRIALVASVALLLAAPASAGAAEVFYSGGFLIYEGFDVEDNELVITSTGTNTYSIVDAPEVDVQAGAGCTNPEFDNTATCSGTPLVVMDIDTRGGPDLIDVSSPTLSTLGSAESHLVAGAGADVIRGSIGPDELAGGDGNDILEGGPHTDGILGGAGQDTASYESETAPVTVDLSDGLPNDGPAGANDHANGDNSVESLIGGEAGDTLTGTAFANEIDGGLGDDTIDGLGGPDQLRGGSGEDDIDGGAGNDQVSGDGGVDPPATFGTDDLEGGSETDVVQYAGHPARVTVDLSQVFGHGSFGERDDASGFEAVLGSDHDDSLRGTDQTDALSGGLGNDELDGRLGDDTLLGGGGSDTVTYSLRTNPVTASLAAAGGGEAGEADSYANVENLDGGNAGDTLTGDRGANTMFGRAGPDVMEGDEGADVLAGGSDADTLRGGRGVDTINGNAGQDIAEGGSDPDALYMRDEEADTVSCGDDLDQTDIAHVDPIDALAGCESVDTGVPPEPVEIEKIVEVPTQVPVLVPGPVQVVPGTPSAPGAQGPTQSADTKRPAITLGRLPSRVRLASFVKGLKVSAGCDEACALDIELRGSARTVKFARAFDLTLGSKSLARATGTRSVRLKPTKRLLGPARRLTAQIKVTATDAAGNRSTRTKTIRVR